mmetsp:Transcript_90559/g.256016  ORF Transcript_90559/g.256016 Transcript_90559/m.256016 type:complete len:210 (+) Transcript_90559:806-1435(+)
MPRRWTVSLRGTCTARLPGISRVGNPSRVLKFSRASSSGRGRLWAFPDPRASCWACLECAHQGSTWMPLSGTAPTQAPATTSHWKGKTPNWHAHRAHLARAAGARISATRARWGNSRIRAGRQPASHALRGPPRARQAPRLARRVRPASSQAWRGWPRVPRARLGRCRPRRGGARARPAHRVGPPSRSLLRCLPAAYASRGPWIQTRPC